MKFSFPLCKLYIVKSHQRVIKKAVWSVMKMFWKLRVWIQNDSSGSEFGFLEFLADLIALKLKRSSEIKFSRNTSTSNIKNLKILYFKRLFMIFSIEFAWKILNTRLEMVKENLRRPMKVNRRWNNVCVLVFDTNFYCFQDPKSFLNSLFALTHNISYFYKRTTDNK